MGKKRKTSQQSREQQEVSVHTSLQNQLMLNYSDLQPEPDIEGQRALDIQTGDGERSGCPAVRPFSSSYLVQGRVQMKTFL